MGTPSSSVSIDDAVDLRAVTRHRTPRRAVAYKKCRDGTKVAVRATSRKQCDKRQHSRMKGAFKRTLQRIEGSPCCARRCLKRLDKDKLVALVLWRAAESIEQRWVRAAECAKEHIGTDCPGGRPLTFTVQGIPVCRVAFAASWGLGRVKAGELMRRAFDRRLLVPKRAHASRGLTHPSAGREDCAGWLRQFFSNYAEPFPHLSIRKRETGEVLTKHFLTSSTWPTVMSVFRDYVDTESEWGHATVSFNTFRRAWLAAHYEVRGETNSPRLADASACGCGCEWARVNRRHTSPSPGIGSTYLRVMLQVRTYRVQNFCKCDVCTHVDGLLAAMPSGADMSPSARRNRDWFKGMKRGHLAYVAHCRDRLRSRAEYARNHTREVLFVNLDGMDQQKTNVPRPQKSAKGDEVGLPLPVRLVGAIAYSRGWYGFWSTPQWASSSNVTLTALTRVIRAEQARGRASGDRGATGLPPRLWVQMDNTAKDNKNHYLLGYCGMLLAEGLFEEVEVNFLPVGHTHQEIDQTFCLVSKKLKEHGALSIPDLMTVTAGAWTNHKAIGSGRIVNEEMLQVLDFRKVLPYRGCRKAEDCGAPVLHRFRGLGTEVVGGCGAPHNGGLASIGSLGAGDPHEGHVGREGDGHGCDGTLTGNNHGSTNRLCMETRRHVLKRRRWVHARPSHGKLWRRRQVRVRGSRTLPCRRRHRAGTNVT